MRGFTPIAGVCVCLVLSCSGPSGPTSLAPRSPGSLLSETSNTISIIAVPKFYVSMIPPGNGGEFWIEKDGEQKLAIGVVLEIIEPPEFRGKVYTMHDDMGIADHYLKLRSRYEIQARAQDIGSFQFRPCILNQFRRLGNENEK